MDHLVVATADPDGLRRFMAPRWVSTWRSTVPHPDWAFDCSSAAADLVVDVSHRRSSRPPERRTGCQDSLEASCWRVAGPRCDTLAADGYGIDVSEIPHRPQAGHSGDDRAQRHHCGVPHCCAALCATDEAEVFIPKPHGASTSGNRSIIEQLSGPMQISRQSIL